MYRTSRRAGRRAPWRINAFVALAFLFALPALGLCSLFTAPAAHAAGPLISWDSTMIYAGQNNGNPEGPVGEHARVHGSGFTSFATTTQLSLGLVFGDVVHQLTLCDPANVKVPVGSVTPDANGTFDFTFQWPALANTTGTPGWSICANKVSDGAATGNTDGGPFTVLSDNTPAIAVSTTTAQAGGTITVTGTSWLPSQGNISVYVGQCAACDGAIYVSKIVQSNQSGAFSVTLTIPPAVPATAAVVGAGTTNGVLVVSAQDSPSLTITPLPPTATIEPSPTVTATSTTVPTTAPAQGGQTTSSGGTGANLGLIIGLVVGILLLLGVIVGAVVFLLIRRGQPPTDSGGPGGPGGGFGSGFDRSVGSGFNRQTGAGYGRFDTPGGYGPPRSAPAAPVPANPNLWNDDWDSPRTTEYPDQGTGYPGDAPTNPGYPNYPNYPGPDDPYRR
jgi:hypothetical protein